MDKGQEKRNKKITVDNFKGMETVMDSSKLNIDVADYITNASFDIDGGIRKREGIVVASNRAAHNISYLDIKNISPSIINIKSIENSFIENETVFNESNSYSKTAMKINEFKLSENSPSITTGLRDAISDGVFSIKHIYALETPGVSGELYLPNVQSISDFAFNGADIKKITADEVLYIGESAFRTSSLSNMQNLSLKKLEEIGNEAFYSAYQIINLQFPELKYIGQESFSSVKNLFFMSLPKAVSIGAGAFSNLVEVGSVSLPKLEEVGTRSFWKVKLDSLSLPNVHSIGVECFLSAKLNSLELPKVSTIGTWAFKSIKNESTTTVTIPSKFNTFSEKNRIFGDYNWTKINFTWV